MAVLPSTCCKHIHYERSSRDLLIRLDDLIGREGCIGLIEKARNVAIQQLQKIADLFRTMANPNEFPRNEDIAEMSYVSMHGEAMRAYELARTIPFSRAAKLIEECASQTIANIENYKSMLSELRELNRQMILLKSMKGLPNLRNIEK